MSKATTITEMNQMIQSIGINTIRSALNEALISEFGYHPNFSVEVNEQKGKLEVCSRDLIGQDGPVNEKIVHALFKSLHVTDFSGASICSVDDWERRRSPDDERIGIIINLSWSYTHHRMGSNGTDLGQVLILPDGEWRTNFVYEEG